MGHVLGARLAPKSGRPNKHFPYLSKCPAVPGIAPGPSANRLELLDRVAALGLIKRLGSVERVTDQNVKGVFRFSPKGGSRNPNLGDGQQRSDKEPPDKG